jgi:hypothetical protein
MATYQKGLMLVKRFFKELFDSSLKEFSWKNIFLNE